MWIRFCGSNRASAGFQKGFCLVDEGELCLPLTLQLEELGTVWTAKPSSYKAHQRQELEGRGLLPQRKQGAMVNPTVCHMEHPMNVRLPLMQGTLLDKLGTDSALLGVAAQEGPYTGTLVAQDHYSCPHGLPWR